MISGGGEGATNIVRISNSLSGGCGDRDSDGLGAGGGVTSRGVFSIGTASEIIYRC